MASGETKSPIAKLSWEYRGDGLYIFFDNPWLDGQKTDLCMFMWPGHAQEATAEVEKAYEEVAQFVCERWNVADRPSLPEEARELKDCEFGQMLWPFPNHQLGWKMRYAPQNVTPQELMRAARELDAYAHLIALPQKRRNEICSQIAKGPNV